MPEFKKIVLNKVTLIAFFLGITLSALGSSIYLFRQVPTEIEVTNEEFIEEVSEVEVGEIEADAFSPFAVGEDDKLSAVLIGHGGAGHSGGTLADAIVLLSVDPKDKEALLVSIPRDLWIALPTDYNNQTYNKINAAYAIGQDAVSYPNKRPEFRGAAGGGNLLKYAVFAVTGIQVDNFIAVDFSGFQKAIDELGGVEVDVPRTFDDYFYPVKGLENETCGFTGEQIADFHAQYSGFNLEKQFKCRYEHVHFDQGKVKMSGSDALKFVRSRHSASYGGDFARSERQFALLQAISDKVLSLKIITTGGKALSALTSLVTTDIKTSEIKEIFSSLGDTSSYKLKEIHLSTDNVLNSGTGPQGQYILVPKDGAGKWEGIQKYIQNN